jgi:hypothetical protein
MHKRSMPYSRHTFGALQYKASQIPTIVGLHNNINMCDIL